MLALTEIAKTTWEENHWKYTSTALCTLQKKISLLPGKNCTKRIRIRSVSGLHFPASGLDAEICSVNLRIQSECGKIRTRRTRNTDTFYVVKKYHQNDLLNILYFVPKTSTYNSEHFLNNSRMVFDIAMKTWRVIINFSRNVFEWKQPKNLASKF